MINYFLYNAHGDITQLVDSYGKEVNSYEYDIYGKEKQTTENIKNPIRFVDPSGNAPQMDHDTGDSYLIGGNGKWFEATSYVYKGKTYITVKDPEPYNNSYKHQISNRTMYSGAIFIYTGNPTGFVRSIVAEGAGEAGRGFNTFDALKKALGSPGNNNQWHHIVEKSQVKKSGFSAAQIQNTNNIIAVGSATHAKISGYYNTKSFDFTHGLSVRDWLAGQSHQTQYDFGINVLKNFGVMK